MWKMFMGLTKGKTVKWVSANYRSGLVQITFPDHSSTIRHISKYILKLRNTFLSNLFIKVILKPREILNSTEMILHSQLARGRHQEDALGVSLSLH